jgi:uncharacterized membrane protein
MNGFAWALAVFVLIHIGISATGLRTRLVSAIGIGPYRIAFSLVSLGLLLWLIYGYGVMRADPFDALNGLFWAPPAWLHWPAVALALFGISLAAAGVFTPGPTLAGFEKAGLSKPEPAYGVLRITRHPFMWGVAFWALGHLLVNGERFALMLFGALGLMVLYGSRSIDRKGRERDAEAFARFEAVTSNVPFAAIVQGRNKLALGEIGWRGLAGIAIAVGIALFHQTLFGAPAFSTSP